MISQECSKHKYCNRKWKHKEPYCVMRLYCSYFGVNKRKRNSDGTDTLLLFCESKWLPTNCSHNHFTGPTEQVCSLRKLDCRLPVALWLLHLSWNNWHFLYYNNAIVCAIFTPTYMNWKLWPPSRLKRDVSESWQANNHNSNLY